MKQLKTRRKHKRVTVAEQDRVTYQSMKLDLKIAREHMRLQKQIHDRPHQKEYVF